MHIGTNMLTNKYTCICNSLIIGNFENPLYFVEIGYYMRFIAHPITKIMFHSLIHLFFLPSHLPSYISTHHFICHFHNKYANHVQSVRIKRQKTVFITPHLTTVHISPLLHSPYPFSYYLSAFYPRLTTLGNNCISPPITTLSWIFKYLNLYRFLLQI
jgi:hypothetical protein